MAKRTIISCDWCFADSPNGDTTTVTTDEIVAAIRGGEHKFEGIRRRLGVCLGVFRVVDRALQKARKAGLIRYERGRGWEVVERPNSEGER